MTEAEEILEKHLKNHIDQRTYLRSSKLTYDLCINAINEALSITAVVQVCEHPYESVMSKCNGELNTCLKCGENL